MARKPLEEGDAIGSVVDGRRWVRVKRQIDDTEIPNRIYLAFVGQCGVPYFREDCESQSLGAYHAIDADKPLTDAECMAQQLLAEGLIDGPGWEVSL